MGGQQYRRAQPQGPLPPFPHERGSLRCASVSPTGDPALGSHCAHLLDRPGPGRSGQWEQAEAHLSLATQLGLGPLHLWLFLKEIIKATLQLRNDLAAIRRGGSYEPNTEPRAGVLGKVPGCPRPPAAGPEPSPPGLPVLSSSSGPRHPTPWASWTQQPTAAQALPCPAGTGTPGWPRSSPGTPRTSSRRPRR